MIKRLFRALGRAIHRFFGIGISLRAVLILCVLLCGGCIGVTYSKIMRNVGGKEYYDEAMRYIKIKDIVSDNYINESSRDSMADAAASAIVSSVGDKWSYYMSASEYKTYQQYSSSEYSAIGMTILKTEDGSGFQVMNVALDSPVAKAGLNVGMVISSVDGVKVNDMNADEVRTLIRSKMNDKFTLGVGKEELTVDCKAIYSSSVRFRLEKNLSAYIQMADFEAGSAQDAIDAIEMLMDQGAESLVVDLRNNAGGLYAECEKLLDYLMPAGEMFYEVSKSGTRHTYSSDSMCVEMPTVVLVNSKSFNAAEMFAQVLQECGRATIMGESTTGSTRSQETLELSDGSAIRLSTLTYVTANGTDVALTGGVIPDFIVYNSDESTVGTTEGTTGGSVGSASTSDDEQLMEALKYLS